MFLRKKIKDQKPNYYFDDDSIRQPSFQRKVRNEDIILKLGLEINYSLPVIEDENETKFRTSQEIVKRIIILYTLCSIAQGESKDGIVDWFKSNRYWDEVSPKEKEFIESINPSGQETIAITWRSEAIYILLWVLGFLDKIEIPFQQSDVQVIEKIMSEVLKTKDNLFSKAKLRSNSEILDQLDLIYRLHWYVRNQQLNNRKVKKVDQEVVYEWHYALNWVTYYDENWDDITTDT
ncbi:MAG: DUF4272 domain-containing protein [Ignavibacteriales bacterium]|nr:MAG: DUF4272 domain-containing protein [Ignavibacteriales bacterium]